MWKTSSPIRTVLALIMMVIDDNHYQQIARDIFGDSDSEDNEVFEGFPIQMLENINWTLTGQPVRENRMICTYMTNLVKDLQ